MQPSSSSIFMLGHFWGPNRLRRGVTMNPRQTMTSEVGDQRTSSISPTVRGGLVKGLSRRG